MSPKVSSEWPGDSRDVVFHEKLGTLADKAQRLEELVAVLAAEPGPAADAR